MIDAKKVLEAKKTVEKAENELRLIVKKYFEQGRLFCRELQHESEIPEVMNSRSEKFRFIYDGLGICAELREERSSGLWEVYIHCAELGMYSLAPIHQNALSPNGEIVIKYQVPGSHERRRVIHFKYYRG